MQKAAYKLLQKSNNNCNKRLKQNVRFVMRLEINVTAINLDTAIAATTTQLPGDNCSKY